MGASHSRKRNLDSLTGYVAMSTLAALLLLSWFLPPQQNEPDFVLKGGLVFDGTENPSQRLDIAIKVEKICNIGLDLPVAAKTKVIDVSGYYIAPGFIDLHSHSDDEIVATKTQSNLNYLTQGVTTIVTGNCGFGPVNVGQYLTRIQKQGAGTNVCHLIPHNALRTQVMGNVNRPLSTEELNKMLELMDKGMREGAWGMSTGLFYTPGAYANQEELISLAAVAGQYQGIYASHIRDEGEGLLPSIEEALTIGRRADVPVHISHLKSAGRQYWGNAPIAVARIQQARQDGQAVTADQYPYSASSTTLQATVIPPRFREGRQHDIVARFDDPQLGTAMRLAVSQRIREADQGRDIRIARFAPKPAWQGKDLAALAKEAGKDPLEIVIEIESKGGAQIVHFSMSDEDMRLIMKQPFVSTASDGSARIPDDSVPHPRHYGTFPRKIGHFAIEEKMVPLELALRSATGLPADILHLPERGYLKEGYFADIVVFNPKTFRDLASYDKPHQYSTGVEYLFVNGVPVIDAGKYTDKLPGKALRHAARK
jgi:N-acyl-D-aspartate/D-glutamate deacylase